MYTTFVTKYLWVLAQITALYIVIFSEAQPWYINVPFGYLRRQVLTYTTRLVY
jgi:hypothetical protein